MKTVMAFAVVIAVPLALLLFLARHLETANPRPLEGVVVEKYVKIVSKSHDAYHVVVRSDDGTTTVVQVRDCIWRWQFNSADTYGSLTPGQHVRLTIAGYRVTILTWFPRVERVSHPPEA